MKPANPPTQVNQPVHPAFAPQQKTRYRSCVRLIMVCVGVLVGSYLIYLYGRVPPARPVISLEPTRRSLSGDLKPATLVIPTVPTWTVTPGLNRQATAAATTFSLGFPPSTVTPIASLTPPYPFRYLVIGRSAGNRPIEVFRFGSGRKGRMMISGIHGGDERNTILLADELIAHLGEHPQLVAPGYSLYILRALNPDGAARQDGPEGRLNDNGVDLNRNFDTNWRSTWRSDGCASGPGTAGAGPGSEPETQAVKNFLYERRIEALIVYHSAGLGVFPSGSPPHPGSVQLAQAIAAISDYAYPPVDTGCEYSGTLVDWAANHGVMAAVDLELNAVRSTEFEQNLKILELLMTFPAEPIRSTALPPELAPSP